MMRCKLAGIIQLAALTLVLSPLPSSGRQTQDQPLAKSQAHKQHPNVPDIAIWNVQSLGPTGADPKGEIGAALVRVQIKNWTTDRTVTGLLWEISFYDVVKQKVVEVLTPYTSHDMVASDLTLRVPPGYLFEVPFYISRKVHIDGDHTAQIRIKNYAYRKFDSGSDKPVHISYLVAEEWPFKTNTEPVLIDSEKR